MKMYRLPLLSLVVALGFAACENKALIEMEAVKDKICACQTQACVRALDADFKANEARVANLSKADQEKAIEISLATLQCATTISN